MNYSIGKLGTFTGLFLLSAQALAHHPMGGRAPSNLFEGMLSGVAHPIIGLDHFAFLLAAGLLAMSMRQRYLTPLLFVVATAAGTGLHLMSVDLLLVEGIIAVSVLLAGVLLIANRKCSELMLLFFSGIAGLFHGFAYGEAIIGAETTPLIAYLFGFMTIQYLVIAGSIWVGGSLLKRVSGNGSKNLLRIAGSAVSSIGLVFLAMSVNAS
ncbi:MAG: HupE/UreJ family protein [Cellvibrionaceae bacterium]|nr:HupE/UreJ family protein [Cellvibrionaceae bacterium]